MEKNNPPPFEKYRRDHLLSTFDKEWQEIFDHLEVRPIDAPDDQVALVLSDMINDGLEMPTKRHDDIDAVNTIYTRQDQQRGVSVTLVYKV